MIAAGSLEYAQARIWARHGQRPDEGWWRRIETTREPLALLEQLRATRIGPPQAVLRHDPSPVTGSDPRLAIAPRRHEASPPVTRPAALATGDRSRRRGGATSQ